MRAWRQTIQDLYCIPEVHGNATSLEIILNRILPLRFSDGLEDRLVMLGDYVDGDEDGYRVLDMLSNVKKEYGDRVILLKGNHEDLMQKALLGSERDYDRWIENNGTSTIAGYLKRNGSSASPYDIRRNRLLDLIPAHHIEFLQTLDHYYTLEDYIFFHGGFNVEKDIKENAVNTFIYDYVASKYVKDCLRNEREPEILSTRVCVGAHNYGSKEPFIYGRYLMLGGTAPDEVLIFELNSMKCSRVKRGKSRIYAYDFKTFG